MKYKVGDHVIYRKSKNSSCPGPRAKEIHASEHGEGYLYNVDKLWTVTAVFEDGTLEAITRRGKVHRLDAHDPALHRASIIEELRFGSRFPPVPSAEAKSV
jgi:hypothetical protein